MSFRPLRYKDGEKLKGMDRLQRQAQNLSGSEEPKKEDFFVSKEKKNALEKGTSKFSQKREDCMF